MLPLVHKRNNTELMDSSWERGVERRGGLGMCDPKGDLFDDLSLIDVSDKERLLKIRSPLRPAYSSLKSFH